VQGQRSVPPPVAAGPLVGRQREVDALEAWFQRAATGARQLVFVSGDVGIGKTTVLDLWLARRAADGEVRIARGQCVEHTGEGEPYLPLLDALGRLGRRPGGSELLAVLRRYAPLWLVHLLGLVSETELERLQRQVQGATQARMLRELAEALEVLTAERPLVLVLEDLHWSDTATVECLTAVAQGREPARLLVLGTYRPVETVLRAHPLRGTVQELCGRGHGVELRLECLPAADVAAYVAGRLGGPVAVPLDAFIYARTDGNALFMVNLVEHLVQQGRVVWREGQWTLGEEAAVGSLPEGLRQLLLRRIEALALEVRRVLQAASVVGEAFAVAAVAAGAQCPVEAVEAVCEELVAQQHFLDETGLTDWPDGTSGGSYRFRHALYQQVLYEQVGSTRRRQLHRRIGARLEAGYGAQAGALAVQLAVHCERGGEVQRAVHYWQQAGDNAARRNAHHEALTAYTKGRTLLATLPDSLARAQHELTLLLTLGGLLMAVKGTRAPEAGDVYTRAQALAHQVGEVPQRFRALWGLVAFHRAQGQLQTASEMSQQLFLLAQGQPDTGLMLESHGAMGELAFYRGDLLAARSHLEQSLRLCDPWPPSPTPLLGGQEPRVTALAWLVQPLWALGYADQAQQRGQEALALARQVEHPPSLVYAEIYTTLLAQFCRDVTTTHARAEAAMALAAAQGFGLRVAQGRILHGWALAMQGDVATGIAHIRQGYTVHQDTGSQLYSPYCLALLAEAYGQAGQPEVGLQVLAEALTLAATTEERWWEAELYRLQGTLLLQLPSPEASQAEASLRQSLEVARRQQAKSLELRAAMSLARLWQQQGKRTEAHALLAEIYGWFTEGFDTADLQEAKALLEALA
jgi:predicted ATPase